MCNLKAALAALQRAGEGAFLVAKQLRRDQGGMNRRTVYADEGLAGTLRVLVYGASNQFFSGAGFAGDKHRGIGGGHFYNAGEHGLQRRWRAHNFLKHERVIDLLPERKVFVTHALLGSLAILDIRPSRIPANNVPVVVAKRIVADKKPAILTVFSKLSFLKFKRLTARERLIALLKQPFHILRVEDPCGKVFSLHLLQSETGVIEHCLICIKGCPIRAEHVNKTGDGVGHPPKLCFLRLYLLKRSLQSRSRFVLLGDIYGGSEELYKIP